MPLLEGRLHAPALGLASRRQARCPGRACAVSGPGTSLETAPPLHTAADTAGAALYRAAPHVFSAPLVPLAGGLPFSVSLDFVGTGAPGRPTFPWAGGGRCLHYALAGEGQVVLGQEATRVTAGDSVLVETPPGALVAPSGAASPLPAAQPWTADELEPLLALLTFRFAEGPATETHQAEQGGPGAPVGHLTPAAVDRLFSSAAASTSDFGRQGALGASGSREQEALLREAPGAALRGEANPLGDVLGGAAASPPGQGLLPAHSSITAGEREGPSPPQHTTIEAWPGVGGSPAPQAPPSPSLGSSSAGARSEAPQGEALLVSPAEGGNSSLSAVGSGSGSGSGDPLGGLAVGLSSAVQVALQNSPAGFLSHVLPAIAERIAQRVDRGRGEAAAAPSILQRRLQDLDAFQLPNQTNRLALVFDPLSDDVPFTFGLEIFEAGHRTQPHVHHSAHELFYVIAGRGEAFCEGRRTPLGPGSCVIFPPGAYHGVDVAPEGRMYCLELMQPNDMFAELVKAGQPAGQLEMDDLCILAALGCSGPAEAQGEALRVA